MKKWQEKIYPKETSATFQLGLNDVQWGEFAENARMVMVLWLKDGQEIFGSGNRLYYLAYNDQAYKEITRHIAAEK